MQISGRFVGNGLDRSVRFFLYIVISGTAATGGIVAAPTNQPVIFAPPFDRGRGMPRPYRKSLPLGGKVARNAPDEGEMSGSRNKPTRILQLPQNGKEGSRPLPTNNREIGSYGQSTYFRQVCRGRIYASRGVCPIYHNIRAAATGGIYAAPTEYP